MPPLSRNIATGSVCAIVQISANFLAYPIYLHFLGYHDLGVWLTLASVLNLVQFISAGISPAVTQFVARADSRREFDDVRHTLAWSVAAILLFGLALIAAAKIAAPLLPRLDPAIARAAASLAPGLILAATLALAVEFAAAINAGLGSIQRAYVAIAAGQFLALIIGAALLWRGFGIPALLIGYTAARVSSLLLLAPNLPAPRRLHPDPRVLSALFQSSAVMLSGSVLNIFVAPLNRWIIAASAGVSAVPVFDIAYTGSLQVRNVLEFGLRSLLPEAAALDPSQPEAIHKLHSVWLQRTVLAGIALYGAVAIAAPLALSLWLGNRLLPEQAFLFRLFLIASFLNLCGTPAYYILAGLKRISAVFYSYVIQAFVSAVIVAVAVIAAPSAALIASGLAAAIAMLGSTSFLISRIPRHRLAASPLARQWTQG
mgnify:CR=1 FL=1